MYLFFKSNTYFFSINSHFHCWENQPTSCSNSHQDLFNFLLMSNWHSFFNIKCTCCTKNFIAVEKKRFNDQEIAAKQQ